MGPQESCADPNAPELGRRTGLSKRNGLGRTHAGNAGLNADPTCKEQHADAARPKPQT